MWLCRGQIPAQFKLLPFESLYASKFSFRPREGTLDVGEVKTICVQLQSDLLGSFSDTFSWSLNGSSESLKLQFKGSIVGPKFKVGKLCQRTCACGVNRSEHCLYIPLNVAGAVLTTCLSANADKRWQAMMHHCFGYSEWHVVLQLSQWSCLQRS